MSLSNLQVATVLSCLLNSCPNLQELKILVCQDQTQSFNSEYCIYSSEQLISRAWSLFTFNQDKEHLDTTGSYWESQNSSRYLINNLRLVQICRVNLHRSYWMGFIKFLLMNACVCERITVQYSGDSCHKKLAEQKLKMFQWASPNAILELEPLSWTWTLVSRTEEERPNLHQRSLSSKSLNFLTSYEMS